MVAELFVTADREFQYLTMHCRKMIVAKWCLLDFLRKGKAQIWRGRAGALRPRVTTCLRGLCPMLTDSINNKVITDRFQSA